jgi:hypothetical protein
MTNEQWYRSVGATLVIGAFGGCIYSVFAIVAGVFGQQAVPIVIIVGAVLAGRAIGIHTTWYFGERRFVDHQGEERKPLFIRAPSSVVQAMMHGPRYEHQVMLSNRPTVEIPLVTLAVTCIDPNQKDVQ